MKIIVKFWLILILASCAPRASDKKKGDGNFSGNDSESRYNTRNSYQELIKRQKIRCEGECPTYVAKVLIIDHRKYSFCTGVLISKDIMMLSSSCLGDTMKVSGMTCEHEIYTFFPGAEERSYACDTIVEADLNNDTDPALWKNNFAFYRLKKSPDRKPAELTKKGMLGESIKAYYLKTESNISGVIKSIQCKLLLNSYANPFSKSHLSPNLLFKDCDYVPSASGAPLINSDGKVAGILSSLIDEESISYVIENEMLPNEKLATLIHAHNLSCVTTPIDGPEVRISRNCEIDFSLFSLDKQRQLIRGNKSIHLRNMTKLREQVEGFEDKFKWTMKYFDHNGAWEGIMKPICFFAPHTWVRNYGRRNTWGQMKLMYPTYRLLTKFNKYLIPESFIEENSVKEYILEFNPRNLYNFETSYVSLKTNVHSEYVEELKTCP